MKKNIIFYPLLLALSLLPSYGVADKKTATEIKHKSRDLGKVQQELKQKLEEKERIKKEEQDISKSLEQSASKIKNVEQSLIHTKKKNVDVEMTMAASKNKRDRMESDIMSERDSFKKCFEKYYLASALTGDTSPLTVYSKQIYWTQAQKLRDLKANKSQEEENFQDLTQTYQVLQKQVHNQESTLYSIKSNMSESERLLQKKMTHREVLEAELRDLQKTAEELASLIDILRSQAKEEVESVKRARMAKQASGHSPILTHSLPWPTRGKIVKRFGRQEQAESGASFISNGIVISPNQAGPVLAAADGHVLYAGNFMSYGPMTVVEHAGDWYTVYGLLSEWSVEKGQQVKKGDPVGVAGISSQGNPEVYFELRFYGKPTDPMPWLEQ